MIVSIHYPNWQDLQWKKEFFSHILVYVVMKILFWFNHYKENVRVYIITIVL